MPRNSELSLDDDAANAPQTEPHQAPLSGEDAHIPPRGVIRSLDPKSCSVFNLNGREQGPFNLAKHKRLIENIREHGQQVPVIVRRSSIAGKFQLIAGTRRLRAVEYLNATERKDRQLLAEVRELSDQEAWILAQAENSERTDISTLERARNWKSALHRLFDGNQTKFANSLGVHKSLVSRMLSLANLPEEIIALVANPDTLNVHFAEQLTPRLKDPNREKDLMALAKKFTDLGLKFPPSELANRLLLTPAQAEAFRPVPIKAGYMQKQAVWQIKPNGSVLISVKRVPEELSAKDRRALVKDISAKLTQHLIGAD